MDPAIPTAAQVRKLRVTSVRDFREDLKPLGLVVTTGGSKQRVETAGGVLVGAMPLTRATPQALRNCRAWLARRVEDLAANNTPNGRNTMTITDQSPTMRKVIAPAERAPGWMARAACRTADPLLFFAPDNEKPDAKARRQKAALEVCVTCPVRRDCLKYALDKPERSGTWAISEDELAQELERRRKRRGNSVEALLTGAAA